MIKNINDLQAYMLERLKDFEDTIHRRSFQMTDFGCSKEEIDILSEKVNNIPDSFKNLLEKYNFNGISIDFFEISPFYSPNVSLIESIIETLEDPFFPKKFMEKHNMYQIGSYNTDLLCITTGNSKFKAGEILFVEEGYDIYNPQDSQIHGLAKDFEQFLITAGNLNQIHREIKDDNSNWVEKKAEFIDRLKQLGVDEVYHKAWLSVF